MSSVDSEQGGYLYLRHYRPEDAGTGEIGLLFAPGEAVELAGSGLRVTFSSGMFLGDFWVIAARLVTPATPVPGDLSGAAAPPRSTALLRPPGELPLVLYRRSPGRHPG